MCRIKTRKEFTDFWKDVLIEYPNYKGDKGWLRSSKYIVFWGSMFFMYSAFIIQSYNFSIRANSHFEVQS